MKEGLGLNLELDYEIADKITILRLKESLAFLRQLPEDQRFPDDKETMEAIGRILKFYGERS